MFKSGARLLEQPTNVPAIHFQASSEMNLSLASDSKESTVIERQTEKIEINARYSRLKRRMRGRSAGIL